jgi:NADH-quinone oxidoreductase subunit J
MQLSELFSGTAPLFLVTALGALVSGLLVVINPNPVRSALFLVLNLFCVAALYLLLNAYFLSAVQVLVYAGAIMVLFLFVIMLLNLGAPDKTPDRLKWQPIFGLILGLTLAALLSTSLFQATNSVKLAPEPMVGSHPLGTVEGIGKTLYDPTQPWLFPFEVTSILLLVAAIGSVVLARRASPSDNLGEA